MRDQSEVLSKPFSTVLLTDDEDEAESRKMRPPQSTMQQPGGDQKKNRYNIKQHVYRKPEKRASL
ncbi:hypothetical protein EYF80_062344 [Liparis tanakae]|uniref:Uncharacterized protein n=1 Tax=Liparis tanakae TaxID=230148 RepID=A0A4Z2EGS8_9TELE|nr:hypothetical protein EYF80_062344 [Liparis tanakae]